MRFLPGQRAVTMSVGEFATFRPGPSNIGGGRAGAWRAAVGAAWHQELRTREEAGTPGARFEVPLHGRWLHGGWAIELQGRLDQAVPRAGTLVLREIKTVTGPLPRPVGELADTYPEYFRQLAAYLFLAEMDAAFSGGAPLAAELVFVDFSAGVTQIVPLESRAAVRWREQQAEVLRPYLEYRWNSRQRLAGLTERPAFAELRPGQAEARAALATSEGRAGAVVFEAPTGFGKTGLLLEYALRRLRQGHCQRLLYLTGKGTGQTPVTRQLRALLGPEPELRYVQLRSRREHAIASPQHTCDDQGGCRENLEERWRAAGLDPLALFEDGTLPVEKARQVGAATGVCPYEITRAALPYAEVWIGDYNYVFSPAHRGVLFQQPGFDAGLTLLVADEAHLLPARAADARSHLFAAADAERMLAALRDAPIRPGLLRALEHFAEFLGPLRPTARLDLTEVYALAWTALRRRAGRRLRFSRPRRRRAGHAARRIPGLAAVGVRARRIAALLPRCRSGHQCGSGRIWPGHPDLRYFWPARLVSRRRRP
jgi:hypothetical protein